MTRKTTQAYEKIFRLLGDTFPELKPSELMADFEVAPKNAAIISSVARNQSCWVFFPLITGLLNISSLYILNWSQRLFVIWSIICLQNIEKHIKSSGVISKRLQTTNEDPKKYVFKWKSSVLGPDTASRHGRNISGTICEEGDKLNDDNIPQFLDYVERTWLSKKEWFLVFGHIRRTNNALESSHSFAFNIFLEFILHEIHVYQLEYYL